MTLANSRYIRFTTYTKKGELKSTPVWLVHVHHLTYAFTTRANSYKVRRLQSNSNAIVQAANIRGVVKSESQPIKAQARVSTDPKELQQVNALLHEKYGWQFAGLKAIEDVTHRLPKLKEKNYDEAAIFFTITDSSEI